MSSLTNLKTELQNQQEIGQTGSQRCAFLLAFLVPTWTLKGSHCTLDAESSSRSSVGTFAYSERPQSWSVSHPQWLKMQRILQGLDAWPQIVTRRAKSRELGFGESGRGGVRVRPQNPTRRTCLRLRHATLTRDNRCGAQGCSVFAPDRAASLYVPPTCLPARLPACTHAQVEPKLVMVCC